jgi:uncharacterized damage-inducible protein DinB
MITVDYARTMARYNRWQNRSLYREADKLTDAERRAGRGAFFGSIHATLSHIQFGDQIWMYRFTGLHKPRAATIKDSILAYADWHELKHDRAAFDEIMIGWADALDAAWLEGDLSWRSAALNRDFTQPRSGLVAHMFNHQTHHRGQVHCMLTGLGLKPDDTDLPFLPA